MSDNKICTNCNKPISEDSTCKNKYFCDGCFLKKFNEVLDKLYRNKVNNKEGVKNESKLFS